MGPQPCPHRCGTGRHEVEPLERERLQETCFVKPGQGQGSLQCTVEQTGMQGIVRQRVGHAVGQPEFGQDFLTVAVKRDDAAIGRTVVQAEGVEMAIALLGCKAGGGKAGLQCRQLGFRVGRGALNQGNALAVDGGFGRVCSTRRFRDNFKSNLALVIGHEADMNTSGSINDEGPGPDDLRDLHRRPFCRACAEGVREGGAGHFQMSDPGQDAVA